MKKLRGMCVGAGYFSHFQFEAWQRMPDVEIVAFCDPDEERCQTIKKEFGIDRHYPNTAEMLKREEADFIDVITPPPSHREICALASARGLHILCQKPLAPTVEEARVVVADANAHGVRLMVHENFRFQPWHRKVKTMLDEGAIGERIHSLEITCRMGDGWGQNAYMPRQPYFRDYPHLFIYETGVHFIDTLRFLGGDITRVTAWLRRLNPVIKGEDCALVTFEFANGIIGVLDANRFNEPDCKKCDPRYTFGKFLYEGSEGSIRLYLNGRLTLQRLGEDEKIVEYPHSHRGFAGDCAYTAQRHFIDCLIDGKEFETNGTDYLKTLAIEEAIYRSAEERRPVDLVY